MGSVASAERLRRPGGTQAKSVDAGAEHIADRHVDDRQTFSVPDDEPQRAPPPAGLIEEPAAVPWMSRLPPELVLRVLAHLDVASLCAASRALAGPGAGAALDGVLQDASLWRGASLTLCSPPWPARPPAALRALRVCSYRWPSAAHARAQLAWLGPRLRVQRLELVGRNLDGDTLRACVRLCAGPALRELSLHDVCVRDSWVEDLATLTHLEALHLDWHTEMSVEQILRLTAACPSLQHIDSGGSPQDCSTGRSRAALKDTMKFSNAKLDLTVT